ncbi:MAG: DUF1385 domain-containing protein [Patescibacteria group bacterium]|nr:DUF1385 domain-containing protein [Patescibacteria group bacterium]
MTKNKKIDFAIGGQAVIEGVMMRSPEHFAVAVRKDDGRIKVQDRKYISITKRVRVLGLPIIRGMVHLVESMYIGVKALNISSDEFVAGEKDHVKKERAAWVEVLMLLGSILYFVAVFGFALFLFKFLPLWLAEMGSNKWAFLDEHFWAFNIVDGVIKTSFFIVYLLLISLIPDIKKVFAYHGAEHKSVWAYELEKDLTPDNAAKCTRFHPRCGTSFILIVIFISILVYTVIPTPEDFYSKFLIRVAVLPVIAGISYEVLKLSAKYMESFFMKAFIAPGLAFQKITTKEPDKKQIEVAIAALKRCLELEKR